MSRKSVEFKDGERAGNSPLEIAPATALSFPVTRTVAGQDQETRHNGSGKSSNGWEEVLTARKSARGT